MDVNNLLSLIEDDVDGIDYWLNYLRDDLELLKDIKDFHVRIAELEEIIENADNILHLIPMIYAAEKAED